MNHPSEWSRFFDEKTGSFHYKHKGSSVVRDTLMAIGKVLKGNVKNVTKKTAEKTAKTIAEKTSQKVGEIVAEKGSKQIRKLLVQTMIPLNRFSFFESLSDRLLPPMQLEFEIALQKDEELIFQNGGTARRIVVRKFELWVPQLHFTGKGQTLVNENFLQPTQWKYLKETMYVLGDRRDANGTWLITPGVKNPKHVFVFFQQSDKVNSYTKNPYIFDTFKLDDNGTKLISCRLQCGTNFYPQVDYDSDFKLRILNDLMNFRYRKNDYNSGVQLQIDNFENLYPIIYFDLRNIKETLTGDPQTLTFDYTLNAAANGQDYKIFAAVLNEEEFIIKPLGNELVVV